MSVPDFERAEYTTPAVVDGSTGYVVGSRRAAAARFPLALVYGICAAGVGAAGYAVIGLSGFMVSIVTIAIGWLVAKAMMTATGGVGSRQYQVAAVVLTYLATSLGQLLDIFHAIQKQGISLSRVPWMFWLKYLLLGPFLAVVNSVVWGAIGLLILFYGLRTAWQMAAGSPGFRQPGGPRVGFTGLR